LLTACAAQKAKEEEPKPSEKPAVVTTGVEGLNMINGIPFDQADSPDSVRTIYFEFDKSNVRPEFLPVVAAHGKLLAADRSRKVELEGHCDERGSREYNIGLGERRAQSVRRLLIGHGVNADQITMISYGEERPAALGHNEAAWSKNRRSEIHYK